MTPSQQQCGSAALTHLIAVVVHGHQAQQMVHVAALAKFAHQLWLDAFVLQDAFVSRRHGQPLHADGAVLEIAERNPSSAAVPHGCVFATAFTLSFGHQMVTSQWLWVAGWFTRLDGAVYTRLDSFFKLH